MNRSITVVLLAFLVCSFFNDQAWSRSAKMKRQSEKPGECPKAFGLGICSGFTSLCERDSDCPGALKCCSDTCERRCKEPVQSNDVCPPPTHSDICVDECSGDQDCNAGEACCPEGCAAIPHARACRIKISEFVPSWKR